MFRYSCTPGHNTFCNIATTLFAVFDPSSSPEGDRARLSEIQRLVLAETGYLVQTRA